MQGATSDRAPTPKAAVVVRGRRGKGAPHPTLPGAGTERRWRVLADLDMELSANQAVAESQTWGKPWLDCIAFGAPLPVVPTLPQIRTDTGKEMATYLAGKVDLQTVAGQMKTTIDQLLKSTAMPG